MKKLILVLGATALLVGFIGLQLGLVPKSKQQPALGFQERMQAATLTRSEESDLLRFLPLTLTRFKEHVQPLNCLEGERLIRVNFAETIRKHEGQEVTMRLDIRQNSLIVILDDLHTYLVFPRLHELGLAPPEYGVFCQKTREDYVASQKQYPFWQKAKKDVRDDPEMTAVVDRINEKYSTSDYDKITREETRRYLVPMLTAKPVQPFDAWNDEKKNLYERVLEIAREEAVLHCQPDKPVRMTIPDFQIGDPDIHVLLDAPATRRTVEWITFSRDVASGKYTAEVAKNLGLADEISPLIPIIKGRQVKQVTVTCH